MSKEERKAKREAAKKEKLEQKELKKKYNGTLREQYSNLLFAYRFIWKANPKLFVFRIPLLIIQTSQAVVPMFFVRAVLNEITNGKDIKKVIIYSLCMAGFTFAAHLIDKFLAILDLEQRTKLGFNISKELADSVCEMSYSTLENPEMQDYVWLATWNRFDQVLQCTTAVVGSSLTFLTIGGVAATLNPAVLLIITVSVVLKVIFDRIQRTLPMKYNDERKRLARMNDYYMDVMSNTYPGKEIRSNNIEDWLYGRAYTSWKDDLFPLDSRFQQKILRYQGYTGFVGTIQDILIYLVLAMTILRSSMTVGDFSMFLTAAGTFSGAVMGMSANYSNLMMQTSWYLKYYRHCLDIAEKQKEDGGKTHIDIPENVEIEFRDVCFKYPKTDRTVLDHVNITIKRGETLSIVGQNGAGKTTFVKLLCRFYEPDSGEIFVNGIPTREIPLNEYYRLLGVVFQDFSLFSFSVKENISMNTECDGEKLRSAIHKCGLDSRIETLPHGTDTYIMKEFDPDGIELSGGEGQKIAIARAVYRGAPIVIFDEPTSALDPIAEYDIYRNFHDLAENRTAIYISHRMSSTRFTDKTAVFAGGKVAEYGTHEELMEIDSGIYREMFTAQAKYYEN